MSVQEQVQAIARRLGWKVEDRKHDGLLAIWIPEANGAYRSLYVDSTWVTLDFCFAAQGALTNKQMEDYIQALIETYDPVNKDHECGS